MRMIHFLCFNPPETIKTDNDPWYIHATSPKNLDFNTRWDITDNRTDLDNSSLNIRREIRNHLREVTKTTA